MSFNYRLIFKVLCTITIINGIAMLIPFVAAVIYGEYPQAKAFLLLGMFIMAAAALIFRFIKPTVSHIRMSDGYLIVTLCWITSSLLGAIPYLFSGISASIIDACFESVSSFTTTGSTVFDLDTLPKSLLLWKSVCNWLGGMGILVLAISILPALGIDGKTLAHAEVPSPTLDKTATRTSDSAKNIYIIYIVFTVFEFLLLVLGPMDIFDALINTLSSVSTSGMPDMSHSFSAYDSIYSEAVIGIFMVLASVNFTLYYFAFNKKWGLFLGNIELRAFASILSVSALLVFLNLYMTKTYSISESLRYSIFQVISLGSTSGFPVMNHDSWPAFSLAILTMLTLIGGCSFSTCGAIKVMRVLVMFKLVKRGFFKRMHPRSVVAVKIGDHAVSAKTVSYITVFIMLYFILILFSSIILSLQNLDFLTTLSTSVCMLSNVGIGLGDIAQGDFSVYSPPLRLFLCLIMIAGRLELFTFIALFMPSFWNPDKYRNY